MSTISPNQLPRHYGSVPPTKHTNGTPVNCLWVICKPKCLNYENYKGNKGFRRRHTTTSAISIDTSVILLQNVKRFYLDGDFLYDINTIGTPYADWLMSYERLFPSAKNMGWTRHAESLNPYIVVTHLSRKDPRSDLTVEPASVNHSPTLYLYFGWYWNKFVLRVS